MGGRNDINTDLIPTYKEEFVIGGRPDEFAGWKSGDWYKRHRAPIIDVGYCACGEFDLADASRCEVAGETVSFAYVKANTGRFTEADREKQMCVYAQGALTDLQVSSSPS